MKVKELLEQQEMDEGLKHAAAAAVAAASLLGPAKTAPAALPAAPVSRIAAPVAVADKPVVSPQAVKTAYVQPVVNKIAKEYSVDKDFVKEVVALAHKYARPTFPTAKDILAVIAAESSFDPNAISQLKDDPAVGLMQVRPAVWGKEPHSLLDPEEAIKTGAEILAKYYKKLGDKDAAIEAYNIGITGYLNGRTAVAYLDKVQDRHDLLFGAL